MRMAGQARGPLPCGIGRRERPRAFSADRIAATSPVAQAALVLCVGSAAFLAKRLMYDSMQQATDPTLLFGDHVLLWLHTLNVVVLAAITAALWQKKWVWCTRSLRWLEAAIFGSTTVFFAAAQHFATLFTAKQYGYVHVPVGMWWAWCWSIACSFPTPVRLRGDRHRRVLPYTNRHYGDRRAGWGAVCSRSTISLVWC